jgi:hypothetical protein
MIGGEVMRARTVIVITAVLAMWTGSSGLSAAEPTLAPPRLGEPNAREGSVEDRLASLEAQIQSMRDQIGLIRRHVVIRHDVGSPVSASDTGSAPATAQEQLDRLENTAREVYDRLEQIERQLEKTRTPPQPNVPPIAPTPMQGRLVVQNWTRLSQYLSVNGALYLVQPGRTDISVPYQQVEAYIPGHELPKLLGMSFWRWTGRDYEMWMDVKN